jgi:hypothetical protein
VTDAELSQIKKYIQEA